MWWVGNGGRQYPNEPTFAEKSGPANFGGWWAVMREGGNITSKQTLATIRFRSALWAEGGGAKWGVALKFCAISKHLSRHLEKFGKLRLNRTPENKSNNIEILGTHQTTLGKTLKIIERHGKTHVNMGAVGRRMKNYTTHDLTQDDKNDLNKNGRFENTWPNHGRTKHSVTTKWFLQRRWRIGSHRQFIFVAAEVAAVLTRAIIMAIKFIFVANDVCLLWLNERLP